MEFWIIIPARYGSSRLPGKPLLDIAGKPMLAHVYERSQKSGAARIIIATDDGRVEQVARNLGAEVYMTDPAHQSGTDRLAEVARRCHAADDTIILNVQGDEPLLSPALIRQAAKALADHPEADIATICEPIIRREDLFNPNVVKLVRDAHGLVLYFSRAPIPWLRDSFHANQGEPVAELHYRHIGLYAYRAAYLQKFTQLPPAPLEQAESLEQLRVLHHGGKIYAATACEQPGQGVDTPEDLDFVRNLFDQAMGKSMLSILFVCMGNICRSPTAEGVFTYLAREQGLLHHLTVDSAGTHAYHIGENPDPRAQEAAYRRGIDIRHLQARKIQLTDFERFDYILAMDRDNYENLKAVCPSVQQHKIRLFLEFSPKYKQHAIDEVPDPYYGGGLGFERVLDLVDAASRGLLKELQEQLAMDAGKT